MLALVSGRWPLATRCKIVGVAMQDRMGYHFIPWSFEPKCITAKSAAPKIIIEVLDLWMEGFDPLHGPIHTVHADA